MGQLDAFRCNTNGVKHPCNVTSHVGLRKNVLEEIMIIPEKIQKYPKNSHDWRLVHAFGLSRSPSSKRHGIPSSVMGGHWRGVMWFGTNIWMSLRWFRVNFRFHGKWINKMFRCFSRQHKRCQHPCNVTSHVGLRRNVLEEIMIMPGEVQKFPKSSQNWRLYTLSDFPGDQAPNATGCLLAFWGFIGEESCGLEWICGCLYVHFAAVLDFTRNEQIGCLEAFRNNTNSDRHQRNVTRHVSFPRNVSGENMTRPE